jgi:hypothetical protein
MDRGDQKTEHAEKQPPGDDTGKNERADQPSQEDRPGPKKKKKRPFLLFLIGGGFTIVTTCCCSIRGRFLLT